MKIALTVDLAHTPNTKILSYAHTSRRGDVHEIYWNIKVNHGMESINNNFRTKSSAKTDWMDGMKIE